MEFIFKIARMHSFAGALKTHFSSQTISSQTMVVNGNTESIVELYTSCRLNPLLPKVPF